MNQRLLHIRKGAIGALVGLMATGGIVALGATPASAVVAVTNFAAATQPTVSSGSSSASAGNWTFKIPNTFVNGNSIEIQITIPGTATGQNCNTANDSIGFADTPGGNVVSDPSNTGTSDNVPSISSSLSTATGESVCTSAGIKDLLTLSFGNTASGPGTDQWDITLTPVSYDIGSATPPGAVPVGFNIDGLAVAVFNTTKATGSNAVVSAVSVTGNSPAVSLPATTAAQSISNIVLTELQPEAATSGGTTDEFVCLTLSGGSWTAPSGTLNVVTASVGNSTAGTVAAAGGVLSFKDTPAGASQTATTFTISGTSVTSGPTPGPVTITVTNATSAACTTANTLATGIQVYGVMPVFDRIWGQDAEGTAVAQFSQEFGCDKNVILAQDGYFSDALAASYLAGELDTGVLLTNSTTLSTETANAIAAQGVDNVYIVGGVDAVSPAIATQLQGTTATGCESGGVDDHAAPGGDISVQRIAGNIADDTAADIATACNTGAISGCLHGAGNPVKYVGQADLSGLYTTNPYNDTQGTQSSTASGTGVLPTVVVAADDLFQDADAAGALAFDQNFPVLITPSNSLSTDVSTAIENMGVKQVILMGGQFAVQNSVESAIAALPGVSVVRVAGQDYTDTAQLLAQLELSTTAKAGFSWDDGGSVCIARGDYFADSLGAGPFCGDETEPLLFTIDPNTTGTYTPIFLGAQGALNDITNLDVFGGVLAEAASTVTQLQDDVAQG